jgi:hypothetical protein
VKECLTACQFWSEIKDVETLLTRYMEMKLVAKVRLYPSTSGCDETVHTVSVGFPCNRSGKDA